MFFKYREGDRILIRSWYDEFPEATAKVTLAAANHCIVRYSYAPDDPEVLDVGTTYVITLISRKQVRTGGSE